MKYAALLILLIMAESLFSQDTDSLRKKLHAEVLPNSSDTVFTGTISVYENRETNQGRRIDLYIVLIPALKKSAPATPIFYIEGGPGVAAASPFNISFYSDPASGYRNHDVVLVDIRGTGKSNPLNCMSLQVKANLQDQFDEMYPAEAVKECYNELSKHADLTQYTTPNVVKDLEDVRKFLGYKKIGLFGLSYGTRVCLVYMKMFPESIESCVLWSPVPSYAHMPLYHARFAQNTLDSLFTECERDSLCHAAFPNLRYEFNDLMQKGKRGPFEVEHADAGGRQEPLKISWDAYETELRFLMYSPAGLRSLPYVIHQSYLGNFEPFLALFPEGPDTSTAIAEGLYLCVTCTEDVPFIKDREIDSLTRGTFIGTYRIDQQKSACRNWTRGKIPDDYFTPTSAGIPTLIFSGGMDPVTPYSNAEEIASHLPHSSIVYIPAMSHMFDGLNHPECFDQTVIDFFDHPTDHVNADCVQGMTPPDFKVK
ncbi:MAG: alpha/beta hydrolase [Bacteroidetes bacterium]|nr:alpha/beta hydrolase [Bacteroidota bacterium]